eukprot:SAG11_NODE_16407_length_548_cov_0.801782_1_plen_114_part_00
MRRRRSTTLAESAAEVRCSDGVLEGATMSDHGFVIINRFFEAEGNGADNVAPGALAVVPDATPGRITTSGGARRAFLSSPSAAMTGCPHPATHRQQPLALFRDGVLRLVGDGS